MKKNIHYTIECINKSFTYEEWNNWIRDKRGNVGNIIVYEYNGYKFNSCDVCLNPTMIPIYNAVQIKYAQCNDREWCYGINTLSGGSPCSYKERYQSKEEAISKGYEVVRRWVESSMRWYEKMGADYTTSLRESRAALKAIDNAIALRANKQLTLF